MRDRLITELKPFGIQLSPAVPGADVRALPSRLLQGLVREYKLVLLRGWTGVSSTVDLTGFGEGLGPLLEWPYGYVSELTEQDDTGDVAMHWDGLFLPVVPEFRILHCVVAPPPGGGGESTFCDTGAILRDSSPAMVQRWSEVVGGYRGKSAFYDAEINAPLVDRHPHSGERVLRYVEPAPGGPRHSFSGLSDVELEVTHRELTDRLYHPDYCHVHSWQYGDLIVADNFTLLHGRTAFPDRSPRHLRLVHVAGAANPHLVG
ncbi:TauD/TfdA family dioxygenase [Pseudonocardiaceae bacterium YIM PH 21723]|nr:TauD/TfdA family dioxygenase [Pseudonocardiaceae bacterium YIM PH 21723]